MKKILLLAFLVLSLKSTASHLSGGWIEADVINSSTLKVRLKLITDCTGIPLSYAAENVKISIIPSAGSSSPTVLQFPINFIDTMVINTYCNSNLSTCNGGVNKGFMLWIYEGIVVLPNNFSNSVRLFWEACCGPGNASNFPNTSNSSIYTDLYNINSIQNASPIKLSYDIAANANDTNQISYSFIDLDADSLNYVFSNPIDNANPISIIPYYSGFSANQPLGNGLLSTLNPINGNYKFKTPPLNGIFGIAFEIYEYRYGQLLSKTHCEQVIINLNTFSTGIFNYNAQGPVKKEFKTCQLDTVTYTINFNLNDSINISLDSLINYSGAILSIVNVSPTQKKAQFIWQAPANYISLKPDKLVFRIKKFACPYLKNLTYVTKYNVNPCQNDSVWPGDINLDKTVNLIDAIYLAFAYNDNGSPRLNPTINWTPQFATNWTNNFAVGSNYKHADCDGNGTVDIADALAIAFNYGLTHSKMSSSNSGISSSTIYDPTINLGVGTPTSTNTIVSIPVTLGDATKKVLGGNAVLFKIDANPNIIDASTLIFTPNAGIIANVNDIVTTQYIDQTNADLYIAFVKKNGGIFSGSGAMGTLSFKIKANATPGNTSLSVDQPQLFAPKMYPMPVKAGPVKTLNVVSGLNTLASLKTLSITPNPFKNNFKVANDKTINAYEIMDVTGKVILQKNINATNFEVHTEQLNQGIYFIKLFVSGKTIVSKLVKE